MCGEAMVVDCPDYLAGLDVNELGKMAVAGEQILECYRVLGQSDANVVAELLKGQGDFFEWDHYPKGDVYDSETCSQYYYHAHPPETRLVIYGVENGHFHTFVRPKGMPEGVKPAPVPDYVKLDGPNDELTHLVGISMDRQGCPIRLFTSNRWVTGETWYAADDVLKTLGGFNVDKASPPRMANIWITAMMRLFVPQIRWLIRERDRALAEWGAKNPAVNPYEDRNLEIASFVDISVEGQMAAIRQAQGQLQGGGQP